jgi:hypothetical protein
MAPGSIQALQNGRVYPRPFPLLKPKMAGNRDAMPDCTVAIACQQMLPSGKQTPTFMREIEFSFLNGNSMVRAGPRPIFNVVSASKIVCEISEIGTAIMFTKITTALVIILGITSGALAATTHRQHNSNPTCDMHCDPTKLWQHGYPITWDMYKCSTKTWQDPSVDIQ